MQLINAPEAANLPAIELAIQRERLNRYAAYCGSTDTDALFRVYAWNCNLCEGFYYPLQIAEIVTRNAIHNALLNRFQNTWYEDATFLKIINQNFKRDLERCVEEERNQHGDEMTSNHVCSSLTFGFWEHLTTKRFSRTLWKWGIRHNFPNAPANPLELQNLHDLIETVRRWRNRIAHHKAIIDKSPSKKLQETLMLIRWVSNETADWVTSNNEVQKIINLKPRTHV